jgi:hypothetical protein
MTMSKIIQYNKYNECHKPTESQVINWLYGTFRPDRYLTI